MSARGEKWEFLDGPHPQIFEYRRSGRWTFTEFETFTRELRPRMASYGARGPFCCLVDLRELSPHGERITEGMRSNMAFAVSQGLLRSAQIVSRSLMRMQFRRLSTRVDEPSFRSFAERDEALAWLLKALGEGAAR
ncbi:MAG: hypothetical protein H6713_07375 [Myxococcales bacterium]|nr:hypothetical protein [Myxococcales bacterium]MCB9749811.1 hypothetical protein [Myxococcales bacterium]